MKNALSRSLAARRWSGPGIVLLVLGLGLARVVDPGVVVTEAVVDGTPTLTFAPATPGPHPRALLAHGVTASKETLFRLGEALALAGFQARAIDLPGHGASTRSFSPARNPDVIAAAAAAFGPVDVYVGHSMGAWAGAPASSRFPSPPRLFVAVGALPEVAPVPTLLALGRYEEAVSVAEARRRGAGDDGVRVVVSPWSDHALEPWDPVLVDAIVDASLQATQHAGVPPRPSWWRWRLLGVVLALAGALFTFRGVATGLAVVVVVALVAPPWIFATPTFVRLPLWLAAVPCIALLTRVLQRLRVPLVSVPVAAGIGAVFLAVVGLSFLALFLGLGAGLAWAAWIVWRVAGDEGWSAALAAGVFCGFAAASWLPLPFGLAP